MAANPYLWSLLSGPAIQAIVSGLQASVQESLPLVQYWSALTISTAEDVDGTLNYVGALCGYPRPLVGNVFFTTNLILFYDAVTDPLGSTASYSGGLSVNGNVISRGLADPAFSGSFTAGGVARVVVPGYLDFIDTITNAASGTLTFASAHGLNNYTTGCTVIQGAPSQGLDNANYPLGNAGVFDTAVPDSTNTMPEVWYRNILAIAAQVKYLGLTLYTLDVLATWALGASGQPGVPYTMSWDRYGNVSVVFATAIDPRALAVANLVVAFAETVPLVVFSEV